MKKIVILLLIFFITNNAEGQNLSKDEKTGEIAYKEIRKVDSLSQSELYSKTIEWFTYNFTSAKDVIQFKDELNRKVIGKGLFKINYYAREPNIYFVISVFLKDQRYKIIINDLEYSDNQGERFMIDDFPKFWMGKKKLYKKIDTEVKMILEDFNYYMVNTNEEEDW